MTWGDAHARASVRRRCFASGLALVVCATSACIQAPNGVRYLGEAELETYRRRATEIAFPQSDQAVDERATSTAPPRRISDRSQDEIWDLPLQEAVSLALENSAVLRTRGQFLRTGPGLLTDSGTVFDPALQETEVSFNRQGVEAALSEFDAQYSSSILWGRDERIQNNPFNSGGLPAGSTLQEDTAVYQAQLAKQMANGGRFSLTNTWNYEYNNSPVRLFPSVYTGQVEAEYRHPLLAGSGTAFTRTAGSVFRRDAFREGSGLDQGVLIARIRSDQALADFQAQVTNLIKDVEDVYWELSLAYHVYHTEVVARNSALRTWRESKTKFDLGLERGTAADEAQAQDQYLDARSRTQGALADLYNTEAQLRRLLALPLNDGRIIRPLDEPVRAEFVPDWNLAVQEALQHRPELRRQRWEIRSFAAQVDAAKSLTKPRLDFVSRYRVNAFGDNLSGQTDDDKAGTPQGLNSAFETLTQGDQTGWNLGFQFSAPIGFRAAHAQVRNLELKLAKSRRLLAEQETEITYELGQAFTEIDRWHAVAKTNSSRRVAAQRRVDAYLSEYEAGRLESVDALLRAQAGLAQAENAFYRSLVQYNTAITSLYYRKGTLLERNGIRLAEGPWKNAAYDDALRRAWARTAAFPADWVLSTSPGEITGKRPPEAMPDVSFASDEVEEGPAPLEPPTEAAPAPQLTPPEKLNPPEDRPERIILKELPERE